jgi:hypothetical protein
MAELLPTSSKIKEVKMKRNEILVLLNEKRQKCTVYTRVMGYHRPVESFNVGKTGEHRQRKQFVEQQNCL